MNTLANHTYLVVGGSRGIGAAAAVQLLDAGADVIIWSRSKPEDARLSAVTHSSVDVTRPFEDQDVEVPPVLHGVVYAPGSINLGAFKQLKPEVYEQDYNLNVIGAVRVLKAVGDSLNAAEGSSVVFYGTVAARVGMQFHASVASAKSGLYGLMISLAAELAPRKIRLNMIAPSLTDTPLASRLLSNDKKREAAAERHPLKRVGHADDMARATCFLLDPANSWITGQVIGVDGGMSIISGL